MKNNTYIPLIVTLFVLIGFPVFFFLISLFTGQWEYLMWSIPPSFVAGFTGLMVTRKHAKEGNRA